jgi:hypothetical protein
MAVDLVKQAFVHVEQAQVEVQRLMAQAASSGDLDAVGRLMELAKALRDALAKKRVPSAQEASSPNGSPKKSRPGRASKAAGELRKRARRGNYPRFVQDGEVLVKVGWSKSSHSEYEHRATKDILLDVVNALQKTGKTSRFTLEQILPMTASRTSTEVPNYQVYLCVAWLRTCGLIEQHGRQGYSIPIRERLPEDVEREWQKLASS